MQNITIIGGTSGFGEWTAKFLLEHFESQITLTITGTNKEKSERVSQELWCKYSLDNIEAVKNADITIFSAPIARTEDIIRQVCPYLKKGSMVLDVTSIKKSPSRAMQETCDSSILVVPTHPMFGPYISTIAGQIFVLTPEENVKSDTRYIALIDFLEHHAAKVIETTPQEHDRMMAVVQWLTHFNMFVFGETVKNLELDICRSFDFVSPIYKIMISSVARYIDQNPKLYSDIQIYNDEIIDVHHKFMQATDKYHQIIEQKDETWFINSVNENKIFFWDNGKAGQIYTDKIIYLIWKQSELAEENIWKQVTLKNIYSKKTISWMIENFKKETIYINSIPYHIDQWEIII